MTQHSTFKTKKQFIHWANKQKDPVYMLKDSSLYRITEKSVTKQTPIELVSRKCLKTVIMTAIVG